MSFWRKYYEINIWKPVITEPQMLVVGEHEFYGFDLINLKLQPNVQYKHFSVSYVQLPNRQKPLNKTAILKIQFVK